jgi:hypothetical protein
MDRKALLNEYKHRQITGGVFRITNIQNGRFLLDYTPNIQARQNAFDFSVSQNSCPDYKLKPDFDALGIKVFKFEILEILDKKAEQSQDDFLTDLQLLGVLWGEKLDASKKY